MKSHMVAEVLIYLSIDLSICLSNDLSIQSIHQCANIYHILAVVETNQWKHLSKLFI